MEILIQFQCAGCSRRRWSSRPCDCESVGLLALIRPLVERCSNGLCPRRRVVVIDRGHRAHSAARGPADPGRADRPPPVCGGGDGSIPYGQFKRTRKP